MATTTTLTSPSEDTHAQGATQPVRRISAPKRLLYGPGPSMVEPQAYEAMTQPVLGIRDPYFLQIVAEVQTSLREAFGTTNDWTFTLPASGSGAMEAAVANFVPPGSKLAVFAAGVFADRLIATAERQRATVVRLERPWGEVFSAEEAAAFIDRERPDAVAFVQAETSTGAYQSGADIAAAARAARALVIADCVTSLGAMPVELDRIGIDVAFSCSQKGLSCPAGLSPISLSPRAVDWLTARPEAPSTWYLDLKLIAKYFGPDHVYHHTPCPTLYYAMHQVLMSIAEEGLLTRWARHAAVSERLMEGLEKLGFEPLVKNAAHRIKHITTVVPPPHIDEAKLRGHLLENYNIEIAPGLGKLSGKILRIGTMGPLATVERVKFLLDAIAASI